MRAAGMPLLTPLPPCDGVSHDQGTVGTQLMYTSTKCGECGGGVTQHGLGSVSKPGYYAARTARATIWQPVEVLIE